MDWQSIIIKIVSALLATLGAWVLAKVKSLINTKIKNEKARNLLQGATNVVSNAVKATYWWREYKIRKGLGNTLPPYDRIWFEGWATRLGEKHFN